MPKLATWSDAPAKQTSRETQTPQDAEQGAPPSKCHRLDLDCKRSLNSLCDLLTFILMVPISIHFPYTNCFYTNTNCMYRYIYVTSLIYMNTSMPQCNCLCSRDRYRTHFYYLAVESRFYNDVVECLLVDPAAQVRFPPRAVVIFLHPVTFGDQCGIHGLCFGHQDGMS